MVQFKCIFTVQCFGPVDDIAFTIYFAIKYSSDFLSESLEWCYNSKWLTGGRIVGQLTFITQALHSVEYNKNIKKSENYNCLQAYLIQLNWI